MTLPRISVVTVAMNDVHGLARTIDSVAQQCYKNIQYVVIDGGSSDGSLELVESKKLVIDIMLSEPDEGIYHAMNKALSLADGEWVIFMNAGDVFAAPDTLSVAASCIEGNADVVYSDWIYRESGKRVKASSERMIVRHQSVIYRKSLHATYGTYVVDRHVTIADFVFFLSLSSRIWVYCKTPISVCEQKGVSAKPEHFYQRIVTEFMFGRRSRFYSAFILLMYPLYRFLKLKV